MEKMVHFNRERVPERMVHAKGAGALSNLRWRYTVMPIATAMALGTSISARLERSVGS